MSQTGGMTVSHKTTFVLSFKKAIWGKDGFYTSIFRGEIFIFTKLGDTVKGIHCHIKHLMRKW